MNKIEEYLNNKYNFDDFKVVVQGLNIYTNRVGMVVGKNGINIKFLNEKFEANYTVIDIVNLPKVNIKIN